MAAGGYFEFKQLLSPDLKITPQQYAEWLSIVAEFDVEKKEHYDCSICKDWMKRREELTDLERRIGDLMLAAGGCDKPTEEHPAVKELLDKFPLRNPDIAWFLCLMMVATKHPSLSEASSRLMPFLGESYFGYPSDYKSMFGTWMKEYEDEVNRVLVTAGISN